MKVQGLVAAVLALVVGIVVAVITGGGLLAVIVVIVAVVSVGAFASVVRIPRIVGRGLLGLGALLGFVALLVAVVDGFRGHRTDGSTVLAALAAGLAVLLVVVGLPAREDRPIAALRLGAVVLAAVGLVAAVVLALAVPYLPQLRGVSYDAADQATELSLAAPAGVEEGDVLVAAVHHGGAGTVRAPEGWNLLVTEPVAGATDETVTVFTRTATDDEADRYAFATDTPGGAVGGVTAWSHVGGVALRAQSAGPGAPVTVPAVTASDASGVLLYVASATGPATVAAPDALTEMLQARTDGVFKGTTSVLVPNDTDDGTVDAQTLPLTGGSGGWSVQVLELDPA